MKEYIIGFKKFLKELYHRYSRRTYKKLYMKRFKNQLDILKGECDEKFFLYYIDRITDGYKEKIIQKELDGDSQFITKEKIRLKVKINSLEKRSYSFKYLAALLSVLTVVFVFVIDNIIKIPLDTVKFIAMNAVENVQQADSKRLINDIIVNLSKEMSQQIYTAAVVFIIVIFSMVILNEAIEDFLKKKANKEIEFQRYCIFVLEEIEKRYIIEH